jgi:quinol monooxygenase YgiN
MTAFVQIIEFETDKLDEFRRLQDEMRQSSGGEARFTNGVVAQDRDKPNSYVVMVEFPSYEAAQANNNDPRTQELAKKMSALASTKTTFHNLDVIERMP